MINVNKRLETINMTHHIQIGNKSRVAKDGSQIILFEFPDFIQDKQENYVLSIAYSGITGAEQFYLHMAGSVTGVQLDRFKRKVSQYAKIIDDLNKLIFDMRTKGFK